MLLGEENLPTRTFGRTPPLHVSLQRSELPVTELARIFPLQRLEYRFRFQAGVRLHLLLNLFPYPLKRIFAGSPRPFRLALARQLAGVPVLPRRFHIHAGLGGSQLLRLFRFGIAR